MSDKEPGQMLGEAWWGPKSWEVTCPENRAHCAAVESAIRAAALEEAQAKYDALADSQYRAGAQAGFNAAQDDNPNEALAALLNSRTGCVAAIRALNGDKG